MPYPKYDSCRRLPSICICGGNVLSSIGAAKNNTNQRDIKVLLKAYRGAICIGIIVYIGYITVGRIIIKHIFNEISFDLISLLDIGMISIYFEVFAAINSQYLFVQGYANKRLLRTLICLLFNIFCGILFWFQNLVSCLQYGDILLHNYHGRTI